MFSLPEEREDAREASGSLLTTYRMRVIERVVVCARALFAVDMQNHFHVHHTVFVHFEF